MRARAGYHGRRLDAIRAKPNGVQRLQPIAHGISFKDLALAVSSGHLDDMQFDFRKTFNNLTWGEFKHQLRSGPMQAARFAEIRRGIQEAKEAQRARTIANDAVAAATTRSRRIGPGNLQRATLKIAAEDAALTARQTKEAKTMARTAGREAAALANGVPGMQQIMKHRFKQPTEPVRSGVRKAASEAARIARDRKEAVRYADTRPVRDLWTA